MGRLLSDDSNELLNRFNRLTKKESSERIESLSWIGLPNANGRHP